MSETRTFHLGDIVAAGTGCLVAPRGIEAVYEILNWLTGDNLYTHQLPRAGRESAPWLARWFPWYSQIDTSVVTKDNWRSKLDEWVALYGETHSVPRIPRDDHTHRDPVEELQEMVGDKPIIVIEP